MKKTTSLMVLIAGFLLAGASKTAAQTPFGGKLFIGVNGGVQTQSRTIDSSGSLTIFNQTASWTTSESVPRGGLFDVSVGYKVWRPDFGVAVGYSRFSKEGTVVGVASIPSPISFSLPPSQLTISEASASRKDSNVYVVAMWFFPVAEKADVAIAIGPTFTRVRQELVVDSQEFRQNLVSAAAAGRNAEPVLQTQSGTAKGIHVGVDGQYMFTPMVGAGIFVRYNGGSVDLGDVTDLKAGGLQLGIGARLRF